MEQVPKAKYGKILGVRSFSLKSSFSLADTFYPNKKGRKKKKRGSTIPLGHCVALIDSMLFPGI